MNHLGRTIIPTLLAVLLGVLPNVTASQRVWNNSSSDFNATASWDGAIADNVGAFTTAPNAQPNVSSSLSIVGLFFNGVSDYNVTGSAGASLTLTGQAADASLGENANGNAAAIASLSPTGVNAVNCNLVLASATGTSTFFQSGDGQLLINGSISGSGIGLRAVQGIGFGTIRLTGANSYTGPTSIVRGATLEVSSIGNIGAVSPLELMA